MKNRLYFGLLCFSSSSTIKYNFCMRQIKSYIYMFASDVICPIIKILFLYLRNNMSRTVDTIYRQWLMLSKIPRFPRRISASELQIILSDAGFNIDIRSVQRDLLKLSQPFPLSFES